MAGLYYPHDLNARNDPKCVRLRMTTGAAGYGVFNILLELLGSEPTHRLPTDYEAIAWAEHLDAELIRQVVNDFDLFVITDDGSQFYSRRMLEQFEAIDAERAKKSRAGKKGMQSRWRCNNSVITDDNRAIADSGDVITDVMDSDNNIINNNKLINNAADAAFTRASAREEAAAAAAEQNLDTQTVAPDVQQLLEDIGKRFNTIPLPVHLTALEALISECNRPGVVNGLDVVRDGLAKMDSAEAINERRVTLTMSQFLQPKYFMRLLGGDYDKVYKSKRKSGAWQDAGVSFESMDY